MLAARFTILSIADVETRVISGDRTALGAGDSGESIIVKLWLSV